MEGNELMALHGESPLVPKTFEQIQKFAKMLAGTDMCPKEDRGKPDNLVIKMVCGAEVGLSPMQSIQNIAPINGRPTIWGDAALALCQRHPAWGGCDERFEGENEDLTAYCVVHRKGASDKIGKFSVSMAKRAKLWEKQGPWQQYPSRMLQVRARSFALRDQFADALKGIWTVEEARDIPIDITPAVSTRIVNYGSGPQAEDAGAEIAKTLGGGAGRDGLGSAFGEVADILEAAVEDGSVEALADTWQEYAKSWRATLSPDDFARIEGMKNDLKLKLIAAARSPEGPTPDPHPEGAKTDSEPAQAQGATDPPSTPPDAQEPPKSQTEMASPEKLEKIRPKAEFLLGPLKKAVGKKGSGSEMAWKSLEDAWVGMAVTGENDMLQKNYRDKKDIWASRCTTDSDLTSLSLVINVFKTAAKRAGVPGPE